VTISRRKDGAMYIGVGTLVVILIVMIFMMMMRGRRL
jgi:hypothetical protein